MPERSPQSHSSKQLFLRQYLKPPLVELRLKMYKHLLMICPVLIQPDATVNVYRKGYGSIIKGVFGRINSFVNNFVFNVSNCEDVVRTFQVFRHADHPVGIFRTIFRRIWARRRSRKVRRPPASVRAEDWTNVAFRSSARSVRSESAGRR